MLPIGFEKLRTEKPYINISKLTEGEHRYRIVGRPIAGWVDWKDKKPYRFKPENIKEMEGAGYPKKQAIAASLDKARKSGAKIPKK